MGCVSQPRYRTEPIEKRTNKNVPKEEDQHIESGIHSTREKEKNKIDKVKMGWIIDSFLRTPYKLGGESKSGMDCSGLVVAIYRQYAGFKLPHDTQKLYKLVKRVDKENLEYGDLVFFLDGWFSIGSSHVGIYIGEGKFVHSIESSGVIVSSLDEEHYKKRYKGARRVIPGE